MINSSNKIFNNDKTLSQKKKAKTGQSSHLSLGVHSMPKTSEKSFKTWFLLGGFILIIMITIFVVLFV